jgi:hypothetical protein
MDTIRFRILAWGAFTLACPGASAVASLLPLGTPVAGAEAGYAVALDGTRAAVGAPGESTGRGAAYVVDCGTEACSPAQRVVPAGLEQRDLYGLSIAVSGDTLAVGAPGDREGAVYVFVRSGSAWVQQAKLRAFDGRNGDEFGDAVALEGDRLVVGARGADDRRGVVYVYLRSGTAWALDARLQPAGLAENSQFGASVALDGSTLVAGAPWFPGPSAGDWGHGAAWVYVRGGSWSQQARLQTGSAADGAQFGTSVALDGDRIAVGVAGGDGFRGSVEIFQRSATTWSQTALIGSPLTAPGHAFGWSVALDGGTLLVGAPYSASGDAACGRVYAYADDAGSWVDASVRPLLLPQLRETTGFALAARDGRVVVGQPGSDRAGLLLTGAAGWSDPAQLTFGDGYESGDAACVVGAP